MKNNPHEGRYILNEQGEPVPCVDLLQWAQWMLSGHVVAQTAVGRYQVSTIFLGMDLSIGEGDPVLWETMVFAERPKTGRLNGLMRRCSGSREQAEAMHAEIVQHVHENANESQTA